MVPDVFYSVCYNSKDVPDAIAKLHSFRPALLHGYCRRRVKYADYPGITEDPAHDVFGTYTTGLTKANMAKLDFFEGSQYERRTVSVTLLEKLGNVKGEGQVEGQERKAEVYVYLDKRELEEKEWWVPSCSWTWGSIADQGVCWVGTWRSFVVRRCSSGHGLVTCLRVSETIPVSLMALVRRWRIAYPA